MNETDIKSLFISKYKKALVTGAAGFIGSHLVKKLVDFGLEVVAIDDMSAGYRINLSEIENNANLKFIECDVSNYSELEKTFNGVDIVFHNAASKKNICLNNPSRDLIVNAGGTLNIMMLSMKFGVKKVVHASTGSVYGNVEMNPITETTFLNPVSYYGVSKLAGERYVDVFNKIHDLNTTILRYFHVFGPNQESSDELGGVVSIFIKNILEGKPIVIHGDGDQIRSFTYVKDIVDLNILTAIEEESNGQVYNCASGIKISINQLKTLILKELSPNNTITTLYTDSLIGDIKDFEIDNSKIIYLGFQFTNFSIGLRQTIDSMSKRLFYEKKT